MKFIFLTGIAGMLGSNIAFLLRNKYRISGVDTNKIQIEGVNSSVFSVLDLDRVKEQLILGKIETIIHCAALVNVDKCEVDPEYAVKVNYTLTKDLTKICEELGIKLIFISTDAVFSGDDNFLYRESDVPNPKSVYGKTKLDAEKAVLRVDRNLVVRTNIYGFNYREKVSFGEWVLNSLLANIELNMFYDIFFSPILVNELTNILDKCIERDIKGLYHICSTGSISKYDMAIEIMNQFGIEGAINRVSMDGFQFKAPRTKNMGLCNDKICQILGIQISTPIESVGEFKELYKMKYTEKLRKDSYS